MHQNNACYDQLATLSFADYKGTFPIKGSDPVKARDKLSAIVTYMQ